MSKKTQRDNRQMQVDAQRCIIRDDIKDLPLTNNQEELTEWAQNAYYIPRRLIPGLILCLDRAITARGKEGKKITEVQELKDLFF